MYMQNKLNSKKQFDSIDRMWRIEQVECAIARQRKHNNSLDCEIAALKVNIDNKNFDKDYLISERDIITRNER